MIKKYIIKQIDYFGNWISSPQKFGRAACKLKRERESLQLFRIKSYLIKKNFYFGNWISSPQKFGRAACKLKRERKPLESQTIRLKHILLEVIILEIGFHHLKNLGAPPVNLRGRGNPYNYLELKTI